MEYGILAILGVLMAWLGIFFLTDPGGRGTRVTELSIPIRVLRLFKVATYRQVNGWILLVMGVGSIIVGVGHYL